MINTEQAPKPRFHWWPWSYHILERGTETWCQTYAYMGGNVPGTDYVRNWVVYEITNHWTGSVTLKKEYLD